LLAVSGISHSVTVAMSTAEETRRFESASSLPELSSLLAFQVIRTSDFLSCPGGSTISPAESVASLAVLFASLAESTLSLAESNALLAGWIAPLAELTPRKS
jgi:hypothetical protein